MSSWNEGIADAIAYIEDNLTGEPDIKEIAAKAYVSPFYFQRIFGMLCGFTVGEYIRSRRLTLAAQELVSTDAKVIDIAMKYGYDSPDSFARAFAKFHGVTPSAAREKGVTLNSLAPLKIKLALEGTEMLEYRIVEKEQFTIVGLSRKFNMDTSFQEIPKFWGEYMSGENKPVCGTYGACLDGDGKDFDYLIADDYVPWKEYPENCVTSVVPAGTWAVFPCRGAVPDAMQAVYNKIWSEWLPSSKAYKLAGNYNMEVYLTPPHENPEEDYSEIWIPVIKA